MTIKVTNKNWKSVLFKNFEHTDPISEIYDHSKGCECQRADKGHPETNPRTQSIIYIGQSTGGHRVLTAAFA